MGNNQHKGIQGSFISKFPKHINFTSMTVLQYTPSILVPVWNRSPITNAESRSYFSQVIGSYGFDLGPPQRTELHRVAIFV